MSSNMMSAPRGPAKKKPVSKAAQDRVAGKQPAKAKKAAPQPDRPRVATETEFSVTLQTRHALWVKDMARATNTTTDKIIEQCVRFMWSKDPTKGGRVGGNTITRDEFVERQKRNEPVTNATSGRAADDDDDDDGEE